MNSEFLDLTNTKSDVMVSSEFNWKEEPAEIAENNLPGFNPSVLAPRLVFNKIVDVSGRNKP